MSNNIKLMPDPVDLREVTFTSFLLLGFNPEVYEAQYRIPFNRDMFSVPNRKAMEVIIHFLFTKLNSDSAKQTFRNCWPIMDKKKEQEFRKLTVEWLAKLKKEDPESHFPSVVPSLLLSPTGDKFYQFLFYFSTYILKLKIKALPSKYGSIPSWSKISNTNRRYLPQLKRGLSISTTNTQYRLMTFLEEVAVTKEKWMEFSIELSKEHRKLNKKRRDCEKQLREMKDLMEHLFGSSVVSSKDSLKRTQKLQKTTELWKTISTLHEFHKSLEEELEKVIHQPASHRSIDGEKINFKIPDVLLRECEKQLQKGRRYDNVYENSKVDIVSLVQLWNLSLHLTKEVLTQYPLPKLDHDEAFIRAQAHNHANCLNNLTSMRNALSDQFLPDLNLSIDELKDQLKEMLQRTFSFHEKNQFRLDMLPNTPPVLFKANVDTPNQFELPGGKSQVDTPDAVNNLLKKIRNDVAHKDDTPVRHITSKNVSTTTKKLAKPTHERKTLHTTSSKQTSHQSRIPLVKKNSLPGKALFESAKSSESNKETVEPLHKKHSSGRNRNERDVEKKKHTKPDVSKAQELLIDQIAQSVLNVDSVTSRSSTDEDEYKVFHPNQNVSLHALEDPLEAFNETAFTSRDKVPRTPASKLKRGQDISLRTIESSKNPPEMSNIKERFHNMNLKNKTTSLLSEHDELSMLQARIEEIKARGLVTKQRSPSPISDEIFTPKYDRTNYNAMKTPIFQNFVSPLHEPNTPYSPVHQSLTVSNDSFNDIVTPLRELDLSPAMDENDSTLITPTVNSHSEFTRPASNVQNCLDVSIQSFLVDNDNPTSTGFNNDVSIERVSPTEPKMETSEKRDFTSHQAIETSLLQFTPIQTQDKNQKKDRKHIAKNNVELFMQNNRHLLDVTPTHKRYEEPVSQIQQPSNITPMINIRVTPTTLSNGNPTTENMCTPQSANNKDETVNFITPFRDPFSPSYENGSVTLSSTKNNHNVTTEEVESFIEEVLAKTPAFVKTPRLFSTNTPLFTNDFTLMTPGTDYVKQFDFIVSDDET